MRKKRLFAECYLVFAGTVLTMSECPGERSDKGTRGAQNLVYLRAFWAGNYKQYGDCKLNETKLSYSQN